jgi:hypothetical protein
MSLQTNAGLFNRLMPKWDAYYSSLQIYRNNRMKRQYRLSSGIVASFMFLFPVASEATDGNKSCRYGAGW